MRISDWSSDVCSSDLRLDIVEPSARDHRVMHMAFKCIASIQHGGDPALRPVGGATIDRTLRQHKHSLVLRQVDGGRQPRRAGTDDDNIINLGGHRLFSFSFPLVLRLRGYSRLTLKKIIRGRTRPMKEYSFQL